MKWNPTRKIFALIVAAAAAFSVFRVSAATAATESVVTGALQSAVTLAPNSSYVSSAYEGVLHLSSADSAVACATVDSQNRVVVTGISAGTTSVSYWYRAAGESTWTSTILPVTVSGTAAADSKTVVSASDFGLVLPMSRVSVFQGGTTTLTGIKVNGESRLAGQLLWLSADDSYVKVDKDTGVMTGVTAGSTTVYAIDPATKSCASVVVTVS